MASTLVFEEQVEIPLDNLKSLTDFRRWALSESFPEKGRIDFIAGRIEVDMAAEDLYCHGTLKIEIIRVLSDRVKSAGLGDLFTERTRVSCPAADLSAEPDIVFVSDESLISGRVRRVAKMGAGRGRYVEFEGSPDLVVEIVSDSSVTKDTRRLPTAYFKAGVREFWLVDARHQPLTFQIHRPGKSRYVAIKADEEGFQRSAVFDCRFRLDQRRSALGHWKYDLRTKK